MLLPCCWNNGNSDLESKFWGQVSENKLAERLPPVAFKLFPPPPLVWASILTSPSTLALDSFKTCASHSPIYLVAPKRNETKRYTIQRKVSSSKVAHLSLLALFEASPPTERRPQLQQVENNSCQQHERNSNEIRVRWTLECFLSGTTTRQLVDYQKSIIFLWYCRVGRPFFFGLTRSLILCLKLVTCAWVSKK